MSSISSFIAKPDNHRFEGEDNDEQILYVIRRSGITNIPWLISAVIFTIMPFIGIPILRTLKLNGVPVISYQLILPATLFWYLFVVGYVFQNFVNWFFNVFVISTKRILDMDFHGITYKNVSEATLENIEDVTSTVSGMFNTVFNIGNVFIQTAAEKTEFEFEGIDDPSKIRDVISDLVATRRHPHGNN
jgi:hypothetical protein